MSQNQTQYCNCDELLIEDHTGLKVRIAPPHGHSCAEVRRRNTFIPAAELAAINRVVESGVPKSDPRFGARFTGAFSREMDRLCAAK